MSLIGLSGRPLASIVSSLPVKDPYSRDRRKEQGPLVGYTTVDVDNAESFFYREVTSSSMQC